jgi:predicted SprT family Zn-dependent metalloprotease
MTATSGSSRSSSRRQRDPELEARAAVLLMPLASDLASRVVVGWNRGMRTTAGVALAGRNEIWLNPMLKEVPGDEVDRTLRHELAHLLAQHRVGRRRIAPHGPEWRKACGDLGIAGEGRTHALPFEGRRLKRRYRLVCPACGDSHGRVRPPGRALACLRCCRLHNGGRYDERFRFRVSPDEPTQSISPK